MCVPAKTCKLALEEATFFWPERNRRSDGICGDEAHQKRVSDHNQGNAFDLTHDPFHGLDTYSLAEQMRLNPDPRVKYVISHGRIWNPSVSSNWRKYNGTNPHDHHMHVSIHDTARNSTAKWWARYMPKELPEMTNEEHEMLATANHFVKVIYPQQIQPTLTNIINVQKQIAARLDAIDRKLA